MITVKNYDINGKPIPDMSKVIIHIDDFPEIVEEVVKLNAEYVRKMKDETA